MDVESMGHIPAKCFCLRIGTLSKTVTPQMQAILQSRNVPFLHFCYNFHNLFQFSPLLGSLGIAQFRYIKIQPKTIDLSTRLVGINPTNSVVIPTSLVLRSIVLG